MVMHARKLPRLNDGYFDRNQAHPYQNTGKYASKSSYSDRYNDKVRDSPSNGSAYRSDSPEGQHSPRDRSYHNKSSYSQRNKERDRERQDRETSRSPKDREKNKATSRDHHQSSSHRGSESTSSTEHHSNHDRNSTEDKEKDKEKRLQVGDWSEHISSSGKKYYYNCKTEVSQWEKPKEWMEWERQQGKVSSDSNKIKDRAHEKTSASSTTNKTAVSEKHSNERNSRSSSSSSGHHHHHHSRSHDDRHHTKSGSSSSSSSSSRNYVVSEHGSHRSNQSQQHKGVENNSRNTDRTEHSRQSGESSQRRDGERRVDVRKNSEDSQTQDMDISPDSTPTGSQPNSQPQSCTQTPISSQPTNTQTPVSIASLPRLLSQLAGNKGLPHMEKPELSAQEALQTLQTAILLTRQVSLAQTNMTNQSSHSSVSHVDTSPFLTQKSPLPVPMPSHSTVVPAMPLTHSDAKARAEDDRDRGRTSPGSEYSHHSSRRGSPTSSVSSLQSITTTGTTSLASAALRPAAPLLTPSLANYYREDLIKHVTGWQADHAERQSNRYSEDAHTIGSLNSTKVSAELKMSRSLVRVAEIQSTLQEQRILFLRQQIKELEEWKSQNSFMSDS